ncbi:hypothetical protein [Salinispora vitiensis]|uniref:hypothetical protein n=1 Tax=Salinispora vitiensis TaxID=999544 RepID=UPI00037EC26E|nr:hypothetical protein [Salinispora vitiensis]
MNDQGGKVTGPVTLAGRVGSHGWHRDADRVNRPGALVSGDRLGTPSWQRSLAEEIAE